jgi:hypothetical protein
MQPQSRRNTPASNTASKATISAQIGSGTAKTSQLAIKSSTVASVTLSSSSIKGGGALKGVVLLTGRAPSAGVSVTLASDKTSAATVASTVTVGWSGGQHRAVETTATKARSPPSRTQPVQSAQADIGPCLP